MKNHPDAEPDELRPQLFTLRIWPVQRGLRAQVRHVATGDVRHFTTWDDVERYIECLATTSSCTPGDA